MYERTRFGTTLHFQKFVQDSDAYGKLAAIEGRRDKSAASRALIVVVGVEVKETSQESACCRFFRFLFAINVPRDGGPPLLRQSKQIHAAC